MATTLQGFVYDNAGNAISGATVQGYVSADNPTTTAGSSTTTDSNGKWTITTSTASHIPMDIKITYGSNVRWLKGYDKINLTDVTVSGSLIVGEDDTGHDVKLYGASTGRFLFWDESDDTLKLTDSTPLKIGDGADMTLYHDGSNSYITNATGALKIATENSGIAVTIGHTTSEVTIADNLTVTGTLTLGSGAELSEAELEMLDGITAGTAAASKALVLDANKDIGTIRNLTIDGTFSDGNYTFDTSGNVSGLGTIASGAITTSGVLDITDATDSSDATGDTGALRTEGGASIAKKLYVGTDVSVGNDLTVAGNLTVSGTQTIVDTVTMNAANAVVFEGATADNYETTLTIEDPTADRTVVIPNVSGTLAVLAADSDTAITSTPAELNILDGVTATASELNLLDGNTSVGASITIADTDGFVVNDGGTMKTIPASDINTYVGDNDTTYSPGSLLDLDGTTFNVDLSELTDMTGAEAGTDELVILDSGTQKRKAINEINLSSFNDDLGYASGDITAVTAGVGLSGGGTSGAVSLALDLSELSDVTPANGDKLATIDSDGSTEQLTTVASLATLFAGTGLIATNSVIAVDASQTLPVRAD